MSDNINRPEDNDLVYRPADSADKSCESCSKKHGCISFLAHENAMMHADADNERAHKTSWFVCVFALVFALIFVVAYTVRMNTFVALIKDMNAAIVELAGAKGIIAP